MYYDSDCRIRLILPLVLIPSLEAMSITLARGSGALLPNKASHTGSVRDSVHLCISVSDFRRELESLTHHQHS